MHQVPVMEELSMLMAKLEKTVVVRRTTSAVVEIVLLAMLITMFASGAPLPLV